MNAENGNFGSLIPVFTEQNDFFSTDRNMGISPQILWIGCGGKSGTLDNSGKHGSFPGFVPRVSTGLTGRYQYI
jgi:hypothetical protein